MVHYTCDLCGQKIRDQRFVTRIETFPAFDVDEITEEDLDRDNLEELAGILSDMDEDEDLPLDDDLPRSFRFDLCPGCHAQFVKDPLARHRPHRLRMSDN